MSLLYVHEKFMVTIDGIVTSPEPLTLQDRVYEAAFGTHTLTENDLPAELRPRFAKFREAMQRVESKELGRFRASANALSDEDCVKILRDFMDMAGEIQNRVEQERA